MNSKLTLSIIMLFLVMGIAFGFTPIPGGPKQGTSEMDRVTLQPFYQVSQPDRATFLTDYNSLFYTFLQVHIFSYHDSTNFSGFWTGTLNQDQYHYTTTSAGIYNITGSEPYSLLSGQAHVAGYFAKDEDGKGVANKFLTFMPPYEWGGEKFIVFSYTNGTEVLVTNLTNGDTLLTTTLDDGQRAELTSTALNKWLKVEATNPVSVLSYADQEYSVPARNGPFVGTDFYTWVGRIGNWQNDLNIVAWKDSTSYLVTYMDTGDTIASGMINRTEIACVQTIQNQYVRVTSDKNVSVSVAPYLSWSGSGYARFTTMRDSTGFGAGNYFVFPINGAGVNVHVLSYRDNNSITIKDLNNNIVLWSGTLNTGGTHAVTVNGSARRIEVQSSDLLSVDVYYSGYGADFAPLEFAAPGHDVGVTEILAPTGTIPVGSVVTPKAVVHNFSSYTETFPVKFEFTGYSNTQTVTNLASGSTDTVEFDSWTAVAGSYNTFSYSQLAGDDDPTNDTVYGSFEVTSGMVHDVGVTEMLTPTGTVFEGTPVTPTAVVENFGAETETFDVVFTFDLSTYNLVVKQPAVYKVDKMSHQVVKTLHIDQVYSETLEITLDAGEVDTLEFTPWTAAIGTYSAMCYSMLDGDENPTNDTAYSRFVVVPAAGHDVGVLEILEPLGTITADSTVIPTAVVKNFGGFYEEFYVFFNIGCAYSDFRCVRLGAGEIDTVTFDSWLAVAGYYNEDAVTYLETDENPDNDAVAEWLTVNEPLDGISGDKVPIDFKLFKPYPNPTANRISINFGLPNPSNVELSVYNINGSKVKELVSETKAPGYYRIDTDCRELGSGVYIVKMKADKFEARTKFIVTN
ncbi:MAG: T9SS type A sorting domain-containing protein [candidate division WOR-3 bacterium]|nr:T9SS type A sorting domain-containing protein [candidate division WOR-3 bacterium]MDH5682928.1 T9SS type A sorting domain-containing protein [candidate division WOR-3 bacterium]